MLAAGASVDGDAQSGSTPPLVVAISQGSVAMVEFLIARGANVNVRTTRVSRFALVGETPLLRAIRRHNVDIIRVLLKAGANPNTRNADGMLPIFVACPRDETCRWMDIVWELLDAGADPIAVDQMRGITPMHLAATLGNVNMIELLARRAPETLNRGGVLEKNETPIYMAASSGKAKAVSLLLSLGATVQDLVVDNGSVLSAAVTGDHEDVRRTSTRSGVRTLSVSPSPMLWHAG